MSSDTDEEVVSVAEVPNEIHLAVRGIVVPDDFSTPRVAIPALAGAEEARLSMPEERRLRAIFELFSGEMRTSITLIDRDVRNVAGVFSSPAMQMTGTSKNSSMRVNFAPRSLHLYLDEMLSDKPFMGVFAFSLDHFAGCTGADDVQMLSTLYMRGNRGTHDYMNGNLVLPYVERHLPACLASFTLTHGVVSTSLVRALRDLPCLEELSLWDCHLLSSGRVENLPVLKRLSLSLLSAVGVTLKVDFATCPLLADFRVDASQRTVCEQKQEGGTSLVVANVSLGSVAVENYQRHHLHLFELALHGADVPRVLGGTPGNDSFKFASIHTFMLHIIPSETAASGYYIANEKDMNTTSKPLSDHTIATYAVLLERHRVLTQDCLRSFQWMKPSFLCDYRDVLVRFVEMSQVKVLSLSAAAACMFGILETAFVPQESEKTESSIFDIFSSHHYTPSLSSPGELMDTKKLRNILACVIVRMAPFVSLKRALGERNRVVFSCTFDAVTRSSPLSFYHYRARSQPAPPLVSISPAAFDIPGGLYAGQVVDDIVGWVNPVFEVQAPECAVQAASAELWKLNTQLARNFKERRVYPTSVADESGVYSFVRKLVGK